MSHPQDESDRRWLAPQIIVKFPDEDVPDDETQAAHRKDLENKCIKRGGRPRSGHEFEVQKLFSNPRCDIPTDELGRYFPGYKPPSFFSYFQVLFDPHARTDFGRRPFSFRGLAESLNDWDRVERAYSNPETEPAQNVFPLDDPLFVNQLYLLAPDEGINAVETWKNFKGADGRGTTFIDVDTGWLPQTGDLPEFLPPIRGEVKGDHHNLNLHGAKVLHLVAALDNMENFIGIAPNLARVRVSSIYSSAFERTLPRGTSLDEIDSENRADAIKVAADFPSVDVISVPLQRTDSPEKYPVESLPAEMEAIKYATAKGIVVVEAAGNGRSSLAPLGLRRDGSNRDSGAILVGAATPPPLLRDGGSNFGDRVDCFARGARRGRPNPNDLGDTSAATAIIAGVALVAISRARHLNKDLAGPAVRELLSRADLNTAPAAADQEIGVMPNLMGIMREIDSL